MYNDDIEHLKFEIKRISIEKMTNRKATLTYISKTFNIPIDETRIEDYKIIESDYNKPSIKIVDEGTATIYTAVYTGNADLLNCSGPIQFNSVVITSPIRKEERLYYIGSEIPIITKMTFTDGDYELVFEKEMPHCVGALGNDATKMAVRYLQNVVYEGKRVKQSLLNKIYNIHEKNGEICYCFEQLYTYGSYRFINYKDIQNKRTYVRNDNVIYTIDECRQKEHNNSLIGVCFENTNVEVEGYLPFGIDEGMYPLLDDNSIKSAMIFRGETEGGIGHSLQIYKGDNAISVIYLAGKYSCEDNFDMETIANEEYSLPNLSNGTISKEEIQKVLYSLQEKFGESMFIKNITNELNVFATKIDVRKGLALEQLDSLSPKLLIGKSFDEICTLVSANKDAYFNLIFEQFEDATNILGKGKKDSKKFFKKF